MGELISGISKEARQVKNVLPTAKDIAVLRVKDAFRGVFRKEKHGPNAMQSITLIGFSSLIPDQVKASGILRNPARMAAINSVEQYMVVVNDRIDFEGSGRQDIGDLIKSIQDLEKSRRADLDQALAKLPKNEQEWVRRNTQTAVTEVEFVEAWIRRKQDANNISFADVDTYRTTVNAICEVTGAAVIFGPEHLQNKVEPLEGPVDIQKIINKYVWIVGTHLQNELERAMVVAHNIAAAMQIVDDWKGRDIDPLLKVPTYATVALRISAGDKKSAKALLNLKEKEYQEKALVLGTGKITGKALYGFFSLAQGVHQRIAETGRRHDLARRLLEKRHLGLREAAYMKGKI